MEPTSPQWPQKQRKELGRRVSASHAPRRSQGTRAGTATLLGPHGALALTAPGARGQTESAPAGGQAGRCASRRRRWPERGGSARLSAPVLRAPARHRAHGCSPSGASALSSSAGSQPPLGRVCTVPAAGRRPRLRREQHAGCPRAGRPADGGLHSCGLGSALPVQPGPGCTPQGRCLRQGPRWGSPHGLSSGAGRPGCGGCAGTAGRGTEGRLWASVGWPARLSGALREAGSTGGPGAGGREPLQRRRSSGFRHGHPEASPSPRRAQELWEALPVRIPCTRGQTNPVQRGARLLRARTLTQNRPCPRDSRGPTRSTKG